MSEAKKRYESDIKKLIEIDDSLYAKLRRHFLMQSNHYYSCGRHSAYHRWVQGILVDVRKARK